MDLKPKEKVITILESFQDNINSKMKDILKSFPGNLENATQDYINNVILDVKKIGSTLKTDVEEYKAILKELYRKDITLSYALACEFMILNGCRVGELAGLTLDKYNKDSKTLDIHTTFNRYIPDDDGTKTFASFRTTHLTKRVVEILDQMIELNLLNESTDKNWYKSDRFFVTNTGRPIHSSILCKSLQRANERLKKPIPKHYIPSYLQTYHD